MNFLTQRRGGAEEEVTIGDEEQAMMDAKWELPEGVRAVVFDVYQTLIAVGPGPGDAEVRWERLFSAFFGDGPVLSLAGFDAGCQEFVRRDHLAARELGIAFPEVDWPDVVRRALPELGELSAEDAAEFVYQHMALERSVRVVPGAAEFLAECRGRGLVLGVASNAQAYTLRELAECGVDVGWFDPELCMWSFRNGFSKPDPHVFRILTTRLALRGIRAGEILMVGDREDNDIAPARAAGWRALRVGE